MFFITCLLPSTSNFAITRVVLHFCLYLAKGFQKTPPHSPLPQPRLRPPYIFLSLSVRPCSSMALCLGAGAPPTHALARAATCLVHRFTFTPRPLMSAMYTTVLYTDVISCRRYTRDSEILKLPGRRHVTFPRPRSLHVAGTPLRAITSKLAEGEPAIKTGTAEVGTGASVKEFKKRLRIADIKAGEEEGGESRIGQSVVVRGWVRTVRSQKAFSFIEV